jgi:hypothetical protein
MGNPAFRTDNTAISAIAQGVEHNFIEGAIGNPRLYI